MHVIAVQMLYEQALYSFMEIVFFLLHATYPNSMYILNPIRFAFP